MPDWLGVGEQITSSGEVIAAKTFWDVLEIAVVPLTLATIAYLFGRSERLAREEIEESRYLAEKEFQADRSQGMVLQSYLSEMNKYLLDNDLQSSKTEDIIKDIARVRTAAALRELNSSRKSMIFRFLFEAQLIIVGATVVQLSDMDLRGINLAGANCYGANFSGANIARGIFFRADLRNSSMKKAYLEEADFQEADMRGANFSAANFVKSNLTGCRLDGADLSYANLKGAVVDTEQLQQAASIRGAILSDGTQAQIEGIA